jgi:hypothetical protein
MNTTLTTPATQSLQWMLDLGVPEADVTWLQDMNGSAELHMPGKRDRVERIWKQAITMMLQSPSRMAQLAQALN